MLSRLVPAALLASAVLPAGVAFATSIVPASTPISIGMAPASPRAGSDVRLTGGAGAPSYAWDLDGDGQFDDASGKEVTARFGSGTQTVRAQAVTAIGLVTDSRTFTVHDWNVAPGGAVGVTPYSARVGSPVTIQADGSDPDGVGVQTDLDLDGDGTFETAGATGTATFATPGERVIRARFTDDAGATSVATTTLDVHVGNFAPTALLGPSMTIAGYSWTVAAVDPDGEIVRYEFDLDGDGTYETDRGRDARVPTHAFDVAVIGVRVTDDSGATAVERASSMWAPTVPRVVQVGAPVTLSARDSLTGASWDADGDGEFDDGTGNQISFTYSSAGAYEVRVRGDLYGRPGVFVETTSARHAADIAVPTAQWSTIPPVRANTPTSLAWAVSGPAGVATSLDMDGDGMFGDTSPSGTGVGWTFGGPTTVALKATDARGRAAVTTTQVPFVPGNLGPDATIGTYDLKAPLQAAYLRRSLNGWGTDADDGRGCCLDAAWDADNDGEYDDGRDLTETVKDGRVAPSIGLRVTDGAGVSTTLRRTVAPIAPAAVPQPATSRWLRVSVRRPRLATLLRRGLTVDVSCAQPKCRTSLVAKLDAKTARRLKLRSRVLASRSVSGTRRATVMLTPKARRALRHVRSFRLTLTAKATAEGGARDARTTTLTIRR